MEVSEGMCHSAPCCKKSRHPQCFQCEIVQSAFFLPSSALRHTPVASTAEARCHCLRLEVKRAPYKEKHFYTEIYNLIQENALFLFKHILYICDVN